MEEDKNLQDLLKSFAMQETSTSFEDQLMQKITAINQTSKPLINAMLQRVLILVGIAVILSLIILTASMNQNDISQYIPIVFSGKNSIRFFYFFVSFWIVMSINILWNKKQSKLSY